MGYKHPEKFFPPRPVTLAKAGRFSGADYEQLRGLTIEEKARQIRGILEMARATRTPEQVQEMGPFRWQEVSGTRAEVVFIGQGSAEQELPIVIVVTVQNRVFRMRLSGVGAIPSEHPKMVAIDLSKGDAQEMCL